MVLALVMSRERTHDVQEQRQKCKIGHRFSSIGIMLSTTAGSRPIYADLLPRAIHYEHWGMRKVIQPTWMSIAYPKRVSQAHFASNSLNTRFLGLNGDAVHNMRTITSNCRR